MNDPTEARQLRLFLAAVVALIAINYCTVVSMNYHYGLRNLVFSREKIESELPTTPSMLTEQIAEWTLTVQPWWGFAGMHDPWASPHDGNWPIRSWMGTASFQIIGSFVSAIIYFSMFLAIGRTCKYLRRHNIQPAEPQNVDPKT